MKSEFEKYATKPNHSLTGMPPGVPYIVGNEAAERFSFYGMRAILTIFMTKYLVDASGADVTFSDEKAKGVFHLFVAAAYFTPMIGAMIADIFWGKYKTILFISLMYCVGHGCLALMDLGPWLGERGMGGWDMEPFLYSGLFLIALGAGGIKPCVSANVGDQFGRGNKHLLTQVFNWFYFSINVGAAASQFLTPILLDKYGPWAAFGLPGVLMGIATFVFWLGRNHFVHVPPAGWKRFKQETFSPEGVRALINLSPLFLLFVPMFWAIFDQTGSAWVLQADQMNRELGIIWLPSQIQFVNPILILIGIPLFTYGVYPLMGKFFTVTPLRKIGIGLTLTAGAFAISGLIQQPIDAKQTQIASTIYTDLAADVDGEAWEDPERGATVARAALRAAGQSRLGMPRVAEITGLDVADVRQAVDEERATGLLPSGTVRGLYEELGLDPPEAGYGSGEAALAALDAALAQGWTAEQFESAGVTLSGLAANTREPALAEAFPPSAASDLFIALSDAAGADGVPTVLADAVRAARAVWVTPESAEAGDPKSDEERIVSYLTGMPNIFWQFVAYFVLTCAEIMVSIVCLEFAYSQSPRKMKSFIMGVYFLGVSLGNVFVSGVNLVLEGLKDESGSTPLDGANYYWFFTAIMAAVAVIYIIWSQFYKGETYIQGEDELDELHAESEAEATEHGA